MEIGKVEPEDLTQALKKGFISEDQIQLPGKVPNDSIKANYDGTIISKSAGMALFEITVSSYVYNEAIKKIWEWRLIFMLMKKIK